MGTDTKQLLYKLVSTRLQVGKESGASVAVVRAVFEDRTTLELCLGCGCSEEDTLAEENIGQESSEGLFSDQHGTGRNRM